METFLYLYILREKIIFTLAARLAAVWNIDMFEEKNDVLY